MKKYVLGFLFSNDLKKVVLILKDRPDWQKGLLNGVGGMIEMGETPLDAMVREFKEEAGEHIAHWGQFCILRGPDWEVYCFRSFTSSLNGIKTMTSEEITVSHVEWLDEYNPVISNLNWLVPMALDVNNNFVSEVFYTK